MFVSTCVYGFSVMVKRQHVCVCETRLPLRRSITLLLGDRATYGRLRAKFPLFTGIPQNTGTGNLI